MLDWLLLFSFLILSQLLPAFVFLCPFYFFGFFNIFWWHLQKKKNKDSVVGGGKEHGQGIEEYHKHDLDTSCSQYLGN